MAFGLHHYEDGSLRESLLSILKDVSPTEDNYFVSNLAVGPNATQPLHEWVTDHISRPSSVTFSIEGAAASYSDLDQPVRTNNITAIINETVRVSGTERASATATREDPYTYQKGKALRTLKAKMEYATVNGTRASGSSGVARQMTGIDGMITTNVTARGSGTSFSEVELNDLIQQCWDTVGSEYVCDLIVAPVVIKRRIASFTSNLTRNIQASTKRLINEIRVYDSEVGQTVAIVAHKDVNAAAGTLTVLGLREDTWQHAFLTNREPKWEELSKDGDRDNGQYITEFTVVGKNERASVKRTGYATTL